ncbi:YfcC family protein [Rhodohalobacter sp. 614A]|uniref:YfcC family protein n=1 Tax=Rhodohalobacter sp. 614A TaxID=2908649 RepID=UPI001F27ADAA|nr:SLC13 family permease [Rhodohalobacter sp. 614A]
MKFKVPHTLALLFFLMVAALILTWIVPSGHFETFENEAGREVVVPNSFDTIPDKEYLPVTSLFTVVPRAFADAQGIIFFVLIIGGSLAVIRQTGAIDALLGKILNTFGNQPGPLLFLMMIAFAAASATLGMAEEYIPFAIILVSLCIALNLDAITAIGTMVVGYGIGYGVAVLNPFTLLIAQDIAELTPTSGMWYRLILAVPLLVVGFHHVWSYAKRVQKDPESSLMKGIEQDEHENMSYPAMDTKKILVLGITLIALVLVIIGIWLWHWYIIELGAIFFALAIIAGIIGGLGVNDTASVFSKGAAELTGTALLIGLARSIALLMEDAQILHTVVNGLATPLSYAGAEIAAVGMLFVQSILNFFIPSGSGQAFVTMPLMAPIGDIVGVSRQVAVLCYQLGDGLMNMIVPTNAVLMGILGLANIPYERWFRFIYPLMIKLLVICAVAIAIAVWIGYS